MTIGDAAGTVTICGRGRSGLYADDQGLTVRNFPGRARRFGWAEISRFDETAIGGGDSALQWVLIIVLRTGQTIRVECTAATEASPETLTAIRQVAERYRIPADLTGIAMSDGKPPAKGLYEDPGGRPGVRYWDGVQWSPLLPPGSYGFSGSVRKSAARWADLPAAAQPWRYAAVRAARGRGVFAVSAFLTAALAAAWLVTPPWPITGWSSGLGVLALFLVLTAMMGWLHWRSYRKLDKAASDFEATSHDVQRKSGGVVIQTDSISMWTVSACFCLVVLGGGFVVTALKWQTVVVLAALAGICIRVARMGVWFEDRGVTIRNFWRTRRLDWDEVSHLADGGSGGQWALRVVGRNGRRATTASGTRSQVMPEPGTIKAETLAAIGEVAERFRVSLEITGRPPARGANASGRGVRRT
jgi:hypothetical protein